jgi:hypothetical protein
MLRLIIVCCTHFLLQPLIPTSIHIEIVVECKRKLYGDGSQDSASFKPQVNRMKTDRVEAGEAYSKDKVSAQASLSVRRDTGSEVCSVEWSVEDAVGNLQLQTPSQSDEN